MDILLLDSDVLLLSYARPCTLFLITTTAPPGRCISSQLSALSISRANELSSCVQFFFFQLQGSFAIDCNHLGFLPVLSFFFFDQLGF